MIDKSCDCIQCKNACMEVPGWFTPAEAVLAINAGLANRLSAVREVDIVALAPSPIGKEGLEKAHSLGICTFLKADGLCEIHNSGFKPIECRTGYGCKGATPDYPELIEMLSMWDSDEGKAAVMLWRMTMGQFLVGEIK